MPPEEMCVLFESPQALKQLHYLTTSVQYAFYTGVVLLIFLALIYLKMALLVTRIFVHGFIKIGQIGWRLLKACFRLFLRLGRISGLALRHGFGHRTGSAKALA